MWGPRLSTGGDGALQGEFWCILYTPLLEKRSLIMTAAPPPGVQVWGGEHYLAVPPNLGGEPAVARGVDMHLKRGWHFRVQKCCRRSLGQSWFLWVTCR